MKKQETLKGSADKVEMFNHYVQATEEELAEKRTFLSDEMIKADALEQEFKVVKDAHKEKVKPIDKKIGCLLTFIRDKGEMVNEECYIYYEGEYAVYHDGQGIEVYRRPLMPDERQKTIQMALREGTND
jgi:ABC-type Zn2+ transport system substrate-binding protein/surface adhesin